jgi:hypothetical protein
VFIFFNIIVMINSGRKFFKSFDLFGSPISLLHREDDDVRTVLGGLGTILLVGMFFGIFNANILGFF